AVGCFNGYRRCTVFPDLNPVTQSERFDPSGDFIRRYLPQLASKTIEIHWPHKPVTAKGIFDQWLSIMRHVK
ncbi:FAD-binding domain-containing protein, partial [Alishewanella longhuensis]